MKKLHLERRDFLKGLLSSGIALTTLSASGFAHFLTNKNQMKLGLVTYLWAKNWTIPEIITNCEKSGIQGVELRSTHAHGVEIALSKKERKEVKKMFKNSEVTLVGLGSAEEYDQKDPALLKQAIENTKAFIKLSHDVGGSGVKVRPNHLHDDVSKEKTIEQIGKALNEVGAYAADYGQEIRLEVHGQGTQYPEIIKAILDVADNPNVGACWNCNKEDLSGNGFEYNFNLLKNRFGHTMHIRELDSAGYPYKKMMELLTKMNYDGWLLLECSSHPADTVKEMARQQKVFEEMVKEAMG